MKVTPIVLHLREHCPTFAGRVAAAIEFEAARDAGLMDLPAAYVVPTQDDASDNLTQNAVMQLITEKFDVVVVISTQDARGQSRIDELHAIRASLWRALVGLLPYAQWGPITYQGGSLLMLNRERILYRFGFAMEFNLGGADVNGDPETWHDWFLAGLPPLEGITINVDVIDPAFDKNLSHHGPDGRIEITLKEELNT
jgi:hypothetical protein